MTVVLDTTVLIDQLRGSEAAFGFLDGLDARPACSEVTRIEVIQGLRSSERRAANRLFATISWIPVSESVARRAGELGRQWGRSHPGIGVADLAIAATVEELEADLATQNVNHFPMFKGLRSPY